MNELSEIESLIKTEKGLVLYFFNDRCAPCVSLRPKVHDLVAARFPKMKLVMIDSKSNPLLTAGFGIFSNPAILVFFEGNEQFRVSKFVSVSQMEEAIERPYRLLFG